MSRKYTTRDFKESNEKDRFKDVFFIQKKDSKLPKSRSYYTKDKKYLHIEICVPNINFKPYTVLNTSNEKNNEITILINDGTPNKYQTKDSKNRNKIVVLDFEFDNLQNSRIKPFEFIKGNDKINIVVIHDMFDFVLYEWNKTKGKSFEYPNTKESGEKDFQGEISRLNDLGFYKEGVFFYPEPKEAGGGVIIEGP